jgi:DNA (cytosine-5)-methyltransferase 1
LKKVLDLFSGIGGFSLGLQRAGLYQTIAFCEIEPFLQKVLNKNFPGIKVFDNVETANFESIGPVDLVTAGFPCQDISFAGKGAGITGNNSRLFWYILHAASLVGRPKLLLENVAGLLNRGIETVLGALASFGYNAEWHCISASAIGAPHKRDRIWIVANSEWGKQSWEKPCVGPFGRMGWISKSLAWDRGWEAALSEIRGVDNGQN